MLRNDYRNFKIDRITTFNVLNTHFEKEHPTLKSFLEKISQERELTKVVIKVEKQVMKYMGEEMYYQGFVSQQHTADHFVELTFLSGSLRGFSRWFLFFAEFAEILEPTELQLIVKKQISLLSEKYKI